MTTTTPTTHRDEQDAEASDDEESPAAAGLAEVLDEPDAVDEQRPPDDAGAGGPSFLQRLAGPFRRGGTERLLAVVAVLGVVGTLVFAGLWIQERRAGQGEAAMQGQAEEFLLALTNFDAATVDEDFDRVVAMGSGDFRSQADQFFGSDVREALKEVQASSRGEIRESYVQSFDGDRGRVFAVVDQTIANNRFPQPQADQLRVEVTLEHTDGSWHVADVLVLEAPNAASGAATAAGAATGEPADGTDGEGG